MRVPQVLLSSAALGLCALVCAGPARADGFFCPRAADGHARPTFSAYKENYFATGFTPRSQVKFQLSVKAQIVPRDWGCSLFFAYTQKSLWDLYSGSAPFEGSDYNPELYFSFANKDLILDPWNPVLHGWSFLGIDVGLIEHESNGQAGLPSRSWNRSYLRARFGYIGDNAYILAWPKVWVPYKLDVTGNGDITKFVGYGQLGLEVGFQYNVMAVGPQQALRMRTVLGLNARKGWTRTMSVGSLEGWARMRLGPTGSSPWRLSPALYVQVVSGYAESLLAYNQRETSFRIGLSMGDAIVDSLVGEALLGQ